MFHAKPAGNTAITNTAFHILDGQHADRAHISAGPAAGTPESVDFYNHMLSFLAQTCLLELVDQPLHLLLQVPGEYLSLVYPLWKKDFDDLCG